MSLTQKIAEELATRQILPFARFMELALYCPVYGFYEKEKDTVGRGGDFYTNVSVGGLFGELLAFQFAEWLEELPDAGQSLQLVEAGAHDGKLAKDILTWLREHRPKLFAQLEYVIIEPSSRRENWQRETLSEFSNVHWHASFADRRLTITGVIFSNELLDAMPVHRLGWDAKQKTWFEWGVACEGEKLVWARMPGQFQMPLSGFQNSQLESVLPDGYTIEISPAAENWWRQAASILHRGKLMTIDYGFVETELFSPARTNGTLRSYRGHRYAENILANPGEQDITAHVNFAEVQRVGESTGLKTEALISQPQFLTRIVERVSQTIPAFTLTSARARQLQTLAHPEHLGRAFRVLIQSK